MGYQCNFIFITEPKFAKIKFNIGVTWKVFIAWIPDLQKSRNTQETTNLDLSVFFPINFCLWTWFSMQDFRIPSVLVTSRKFLELWKLPGIGLFYGNFDILGMNSTLFLSLNLDLCPKILKRSCFLYLL